MAAALAKILLLIVLVFVLLAPSQPPPKGEEKAVFLSFSSPPLRGGAGGGAKELETRVIVIKDTSFTAELARTPLEQTRGLSGRAALAENRGMLFVLATSTRPAFWMKEMNFPIDIVWLENATGGAMVSEIAARVATSTYPQTFSPTVPINYVLELPAGAAARGGLKVGDFIHFVLPD